MGGGIYPQLKGHHLKTSLGCDVDGMAHNKVKDDFMNKL